MELFPCLYFGAIMSEPDFPYSKKPNDPKKSPTPPSPTPSPDLSPGNLPNTTPVKTQLTTKSIDKKA